MWGVGCGVWGVGCGVWGLGAGLDLVSVELEIAQIEIAQIEIAQIERGFVLVAVHRDGGPRDDLAGPRWISLDLVVL